MLKENNNEIKELKLELGTLRLHKGINIVRLGMHSLVGSFAAALSINYGDTITLIISGLIIRNGAKMLSECYDINDEIRNVKSKIKYKSELK